MFLRILLVSALVLWSSASLVAKEQALSFDAELSNYQYDLPVQFFNFSSQNTPLKREGKAEEVADLVAFLAGNGSSFISGNNVDINGGLAFS